MITLNNPLVLMNLTLLGIGMEFKIEKVGVIRSLCFTVETVVWRKCWTW